MSSVPIPPTTTTPGFLAQAIVWLPLLISLAVFTVAFLQWRLAREKLRLDLYNRRFEVFSATFDFYQQLMTWPSDDADGEGAIARKAVHLRFLKGFHEAPFLFAPKSGVRATLDEIHRQAMKVIGFRDRARSFASDPVLFHQSFEETNSILLTTIPDLIAKLRDQLGIYLNFHGRLGRRV